VDALAEKAAWLRLLSDAALSRRTAKALIRRWAVEEARPLLSLWDLTAAELQSQLGLEPLDAERIVALGLRPSPVEDKLRVWADRGVRLVTRADVAYPEMLLERLPVEGLPYFFLSAGDLTIATQPGIAVLGASAPTPEAEASTRDLVGLLVAEGHHLVGGYARGVDRLAVEHAVEAQGQALAILPLGFEAFEPTLGKLKPWLDQGRLLLMSPYALEEPYAERLGEARLLLTAALSAALVLIEPGPPDWAWLTQFQAWGGVTLVWSRDAERVAPWMALGALSFEDARSGAAQIARFFGADELDAPLEPSAAALHEEGLPPFESPQEALDALARGGVVPEALARRLRQMQGRDEST
jgi:hypothetical protein